MKLKKAQLELEKTINPDTFITISVKQGIRNSVNTYIPGNWEHYDRVSKTLLSQVNRRTFGKRLWRRQRQRMPNLTTLEKGKGGMWHIHCCLKRPDHVTIEQFTEIFEKCWSASKSKWFMPIYEVAEYRGKGLPYILKDGQDSILVGPLFF